MGLTNHQLFFVGFAQVLPSWEAWGLSLPSPRGCVVTSVEHVGKGLGNGTEDEGKKVVCA